MVMLRVINVAGEEICVVEFDRDSDTTDSVKAKIELRTGVSTRIQHLVIDEEAVNAVENSKSDDEAVSITLVKQNELMEVRSCIVGLDVVWRAVYASGETVDVEEGAARELIHQLGFQRRSWQYRTNITSYI
eukprot:gb/GFBE01079614.1/.p1 GENE.gb/GFBE01079614.1/~~gb/GFBE01079614.1/.p1  ORF type:complete len:132 (+),score=27.32 gb/GFBE01079614.1/:1-396(+)